MECRTVQQHVLEQRFSSAEHWEQTTIKLEPKCYESLLIDGVNSNASIEQILHDGEITASTVQLPESNVYFITPPQFIKFESLFKQNEERHDLAAEPIVLDDRPKPERSIMNVIQISDDESQDDESVSRANVVKMYLLKTGKN